MKNSKIKSFEIYGLFGNSNVLIPFEDDIKLLVGENGLGKTQILNIFYYTLTKNFAKLKDFVFDKIQIEFNSEETIEITKEDVMNFIDNYDNTIFQEIVDRIGRGQFENLRNSLIHGDGSIYNQAIYRKLRDIAPPEVIEHYFLGKRLNPKKEDLFSNKNLDHCKKSINQALAETQILYFPTFRRVEEDLKNLGYDEESFRLNKNDTRLIHFGMDDVQRQFSHIQSNINQLLKEGFSKISSEILSKLIKGFSNTDKDILDRINDKDIAIILARAGNEISEEDKDKIRNIVKNKQNIDKNNSLFYFLQILIEIYEKQKEFDNSIKLFRDVCNKYLINKKVIYDESAIKIYIKSHNSDSPLLLSKLSSGEKQIISIFSKIYLSRENTQFIILFDEPELSLSIEWQENLLPDIIASGKCVFLLAVTHSPFIFKNELDQYAISLSEYIHSNQELTYSL